MLVVELRAFSLLIGGGHFLPYVSSKFARELPCAYHVFVTSKFHLHGLEIASKLVVDVLGQLTGPHILQHPHLSLGL